MSKKDYSIVTLKKEELLSNQNKAVMFGIGIGAMTAGAFGAIENGFSKISPVNWIFMATGAVMIIGAITLMPKLPDSAFI